jgi:hypothetical protein
MTRVTFDKRCTYPASVHTRRSCPSEHRNQRPPKLESSFGTPPSTTGNNNSSILAAVSFWNQFHHSSRYSHPHTPADASGASFEGGRLQIFFGSSFQFQSSSNCWSQFNSRVAGLQTEGNLLEYDVGNTMIVMVM